MTPSRLFTLAFALLLTAAVHAQPTNDDWHHGTHITFDGQVLTGTTVGATPDDDFATQATCDVGSDPSEPSVWYIFAPTAEGDITFSTEGSGFDTILTIHSNVAPGAMSAELACSDDADGEPSGTRWSRVTFSAEANMYYYVRVTGYNGAMGAVTLTAAGASITTPPNVDFGSYILDTDPYFGTNVGAPTRSVVSDASCVSSGDDNQRSVLWFYQAQATGDMNISLEGSDFDTILTVYSLDTSQEVACNDDSSSGIRWSRVDGIPVSQGEAFFIRVSGFTNATAGEEGNIALVLSGSTVVANEASGETAAALTLLPVSPNPTTATTTLTFALASPSEARVEAFDALGRSVGVVHEGMLPAGEHRMTWTPDDLPTGIYLIRVTAGDAAQTQQVTVVR